MSRRVPSSGHHPEWPGDPERGQEYGDEYGARPDGYGYDGNPGGGYGQGQYGQNQYGQGQYGQYAGANGHDGYGGQYGQDQYGQAAGYGQQQSHGGQDWGYDGQPTQSMGYQGNGAGSLGNGYQPSSYAGHA